MSFPAETLILTEAGHQPISALWVGARLPTPLGSATVTVCESIGLRPKVGTRLSNTTVLGAMRCLSPDLTWGIIYSLEVMQTRRKMGEITFENQHIDGTETLITSIYSFSGAPVTPAYETVRDQGADAWIIATDLNIVVVESFLFGATFTSNPVMLLSNYPLPEITASQLEAFRNEHF